MTADGRFRVMVTDEVDPEGVALLRASPRIEVVERPTLPPAELLDEVADYDALIGRNLPVADEGEEPGQPENEPAEQYEHERPRGATAHNAETRTQTRG